MTKKPLKIIALLSIILFSIQSCNYDTKDRVESVKKNTTETHINSNTTKVEMGNTLLDSANEYSSYRKEMEIKLSENERQIFDLEKNSKINVKYKRALKELNNENKMLKDRVNNFKSNDINDWESFTHAFYKDIYKLEKSISNIAKYDS